MRHRNQLDQAESKTTETAVDGARATLTALLAPEQVQSKGGHAATVGPATIPTQTLGDHDQYHTVTITELGHSPAPVKAAAPSIVIPETARWRASHLPRVVAAALLALALVGTAVLGARFFEVRSSDNFVSLVISMVVVVILWAMLIASTPQEVTLKGSVLTVHNSGGYERFDLADGLQPVDLVGDPRSSKWALLLHRAHRSSVVLRRHDVVATELDPIVRHYRSVADQRFNDRSARFTH